MNWWPFVTKKEYNELTKSYQQAVKFDQEQYKKALQRQREDIEGRVDLLIKEITSYQLTYERIPPYKTEITITIDPDLVIRLRDPAMGSDLQRDKISWLIANRLAHLVRDMLFTTGIVNTQGWK